MGGPLSIGLAADDSERLLSVDHFVRVRSTVPAIAGQEVPIYVRERVQAGTALRGAGADRVVLFIHGAGTPAEVSFDVPAQDYSWMAYLARAGFDTFAMDTSGYGRSVRPAAMNDPCNVAPDRQAMWVPSLIPGAMQAQLPARHDHHRLGLERHRRGRGLPARAAPRRQGEPDRLVAGRPALRGLRGSASRENSEARAARARVQSQCAVRSAGAAGDRLRR